MVRLCLWITCDLSWLGITLFFLVAPRSKEFHPSSSSRCVRWWPEPRKCQAWCRWPANLNSRYSPNTRCPHNLQRIQTSSSTHSALKSLRSVNWNSWRGLTQRTPRFGLNKSKIFWKYFISLYIRKENFLKVIQRDGNRNFSLFHLAPSRWFDDESPGIARTLESRRK